MSEPLKPTGNNIEHAELIDPLEDGEVAKGDYSFPIPIIENATDLGQQIADQDPPEQVTEKIGPFIISRSPESHQGVQKQAIDFLVPDGTPVLASRDGLIVAYDVSHEKWGPSSDFADELNYLTIRHTNEDGTVEFTQYAHLAKNSIPQEILTNKKVKEGQVIATTGKTGWTDRDHLHFLTFRGDNNPEHYKSLVPKFKSENKE